MAPIYLREVVGSAVPEPAPRDDEENVEFGWLAEGWADLSRLDRSRRGPPFLFTAVDEGLVMVMRERGNEDGSRKGISIEAKALCQPVSVFIAKEIGEAIVGHDTVRVRA